MHQPESTVQKLGMAQLRINDIDITWDSQRWLLRTAGKIPIEQYNRECHGWSKETFNAIKKNEHNYFMSYRVIRFE
jgi:hypothetical protein